MPRYALYLTVIIASLALISGVTLACDGRCGSLSRDRIYYSTATPGTENLMFYRILLCLTKSADVSGEGYYIAWCVSAALPMQARQHCTVTH